MTYARQLFFCTALLSVFGLPASGFAQDTAQKDDATESPAAPNPPDANGVSDYRIEGSELVVRHQGEDHRIESPCTSPDVARFEQLVYLSCGARGVYVVRQSAETGELQHDGYQRFDGDVTGFLAVDGQVWAKIRRTEARPLGDGVVREGAGGRLQAVEKGRAEQSDVAKSPGEAERSKGAPGQPPATPGTEVEPTATLRKVGNVIDVEPGAVIVSLGQNAGVERDDHIEFFREEEVALGAGETSARIDTVAIGRVVAVSEERARVELGLGERVSKSAKARTTGAPLTSYPTAPPRIGGLWEASFAVRPFLALRTVGAGTISSGRVVYRFEGPYAIHLNALPMSVGLAREGNVSAIGGDIALAYDARIFSLGLGAGVTQIGYDSLGGIELDERAGPTITQFGRIGSRDGLHLRLHNSFVVANREFFYAGTDGVIQIPIDSVVSNSAIVLHGGGHVSGDVVGEAGLRLLVRGNGDRGSLFVTPTVGGGLVTNDRRVSECADAFDSSCRETISYGGPLIGVELEWRL